MFAFFGGGNSIPGVTSDGLSPGGENIEGALKAGNSAATSMPTFNKIYGSTTFQDTDANMAAGEDIIDIRNQAKVQGFGAVGGIFIRRSGDISEADYQSAMLALFDVTASVSAPFVVFKSGDFQFWVDGEGIYVKGKYKTNNTVAHALGAYSGNALPIYDSSGTLLGYLPLYA